MSTDRRSRIAQKKIQARLIRQHEHIWQDIRKGFEDCLAFERSLNPNVNVDAFVKDITMYCASKGYRTSQVVVGFIEALHVIIVYAKRERAGLNKEKDVHAAAPAPES